MSAMHPVIDYAPRPPWRLRMRRWLQPVVLIIALWLLISVIVGTEVRHDRGWVCASCGSRRSQVDWMFDVTTSRTVSTSALAKWLSDRNLSHAHDWRNIKGTGRNLLGSSMSRGHGAAPPIYSMA